jgi:hypothetical protein
MIDMNLIINLGFVEEVKIRSYFFIGVDEVSLWLMSGGEFGGWGIPSFLFSLSCVGSLVSNSDLLFLGN